jgi:hypothetical protein
MPATEHAREVRRRMVRALARIDIELGFLSAMVATAAVAGAAAWALRAVV